MGGTMWPSCSCTADIEEKSSSLNYDPYKLNGKPSYMKVEEEGVEKLLDDFGCDLSDEDFVSKSMRNLNILQVNQQAATMASDKIPFCSCTYEEQASLDDHYYPEFAAFNGNGGPDVSIGDDLMNEPTEYTSAEFDIKRREKAYREVMRSYDDLHARLPNLPEAKSQILSYVPGAWIDDDSLDYAIPKTTTLLVIGPKGSGKSSLVNKISRVFEDDKFASERAPVSYNSSFKDGRVGTGFLQQYMVPRNKDRFCFFDTRGLSDSQSEINEDLYCWMIGGVSHGKLVTRISDSPSLRNKLMWMSRYGDYCFSRIRRVNFVILVVSGLSVLQCMNSAREEERRYTQMLTQIFGSQYLPLKDDMPAVVVTHGDMLSLEDRVRILVYLGDLLGVPPSKQIFDIPDDTEPSTELVVVDLVRYCLEHADRNLLPSSLRNWLLSDKNSRFRDGKSCSCL